MKPQTKENKKKLSTIAKRIKKGIPLTGLVSSILAATSCTPQTTGIVPNTAGDIAPEPNTTEEVRKTSEMRPVPGEPPVVEHQPLAGDVVPPSAEKTEKNQKKAEQVRIKPAIEPRRLAGTPPVPPAGNQKNDIPANGTQSPAQNTTTVQQEK